jgi:hypothetical protein
MLHRLRPERDPLRRLLAACIANKATAHDVVTACEQRLKHASDLLRDKQGVLDKYAGTDELLAEHRLAVEKSFASSGARNAVPPDVIERVRERDALQQDCDSIRSGIAALKGDLDGARQALARSERKCAQGAAAIIAELAKAEAAVLLTERQQVAARAASIEGAARLFIPSDDGSLHPIRLDRSVNEALDWSEPQMAPQFEPVVVQSKLWRGYFNRLVLDADASLEGDDDHDNQAA